MNQETKKDFYFVLKNKTLFFTQKHIKYHYITWPGKVRYRCPHYTSIFDIEFLLSAEITIYKNIFVALFRRLY
jgi:hypothetical protein